MFANKAKKGTAAVAEKKPIKPATKTAAKAIVKPVAKKTTKK